MGFCPFCMRKTNDDARFCPYCGKDRFAETPPHHLPPGTVLRDRYRVGAALGEGGFGVTYMGLDTALDLRVAVKEFFPYGFVTRVGTVSSRVTELSDEGKAEFFKKGKSRFLQEARVLAQFSGARGIVDVRDFFEENNTAYIVMEYVDGVTLKQYLKDHGTLSPEETLRLLTPVMESLRLLHKENVIHRDISPDNIMLANGEVKLLDFGAARSLDKDNKSLSVMLKPGYAPEEQYRSKGRQGPWTDVYALCATMYRCITGIRPDESPDRLYNDTLKAPSALGIQISPGFERALMGGLQVRAENRIRNVDQLLAVINTNKKPVNAPPPEKEAPAANRPNALRISTLVLGCTAALALIILVAVIIRSVSNGNKVAVNDSALVSADAGAGDSDTDSDTDPGAEPETAEEATVPVIEGYRAGEHLTFGSYPQTEVTDTSVVSALESIPKDWQSYGYYCNNVQSDFMRYADLTYQGVLYRAVTFDTYRTYKKSNESTDDNSYQDDFGYTPGNTYYFRYEPLTWRVLDPDQGLVLCEYVIDAQAYDHEDNDYPSSAVRAWLNNDFCNTAFSSAEKDQIRVTTVTNNAVSAHPEFNCADTQDRIFLLSYSDTFNTAYGFSPSTGADSGRIVSGTDYAKCQGIAPYSDNTTYWLLRTPGSQYDYVSFVHNEGDNKYFSYVTNTFQGIRPAFCFSSSIA